MRLFSHRKYALISCIVRPQTGTLLSSCGSDFRSRARRSFPFLKNRDKKRVKVFIIADVSRPPEASKHIFCEMFPRLLACVSRRTVSGCRYFFCGSKLFLNKIQNFFSLGNKLYFCNKCCVCPQKGKLMNGFRSNVSSFRPDPSANFI